MTAQFNLLSRLHYRATPQRYLADVNNPLVYSLELQQRKQVISHMLTLATAQSPGSQLLMENSILQFSLSVAGNWFLFCFLKMWCKKQRRCLHALHSDLCQAGSADIPKVTRPSPHLPDHPSSCQRSHNVILEYFWVKPLLASITNTH